MTKAQMLNLLRQNCREVNVLPAVVITRGDMAGENPAEAKSVKKAAAFTDGASLIVRSSSNAEDSAEFSNAGAFETIMNVKPDAKSIVEAADKVLASYGDSNNEDDEVLVQPMLRGVRKGGVALTADMETFADYYIVNWSENGDTAAVTSGENAPLHTFISYKNHVHPSGDADIDSVIDACRTIEHFLKVSALDIEFAVTDSGTVYILQVRPIAFGRKEAISKIDLSKPIYRIFLKVQKLARKQPFLLGDTTFFDVMTDWNPAEILGERPKKLAISLYKELITDSVWAHQRCNYGYRDLTMHPLMVSFCGIPYIDTRITFNSFVPASLNEKIAEKLVNYYLDKLRRYPGYHDKAEFEIVYSCYYFGVSQKMRELLGAGFNENEIKRIEFALLELTNKIINPVDGLYKKDILMSSIMEANYERILRADVSTIDKIYWLIEECKAYGTLPFAGVARAAFIAVQFLRSFVSARIITQAEYDRYMRSLNTVSRRMKQDVGRLRTGKMSKEDFLKIYGHIRPGTYDIMSPRYDEAFDTYFAEGRARVQNVDNEEYYKFCDETMARLQTELEQNGLSVGAAELMTFIKEAIEGREQLKFVFSKSVSKILCLIAELGEWPEIKETREDMAHIDISVIKQLYADLYVGDLMTVFKENIAHNKAQYQTALQIKLPAMIMSADEAYSFSLMYSEPNFITHKKITADTVEIQSNADASVEGKVVFIRSADPGYDFLFSKGLGALVTEYGGANSHMAIRCAELGIPAVIGAGENNFNTWCKCTRLTLDCQKRQVVEVIR